VGLEGFEPTTDRCLKNPVLPDYSFIARCKSGKQILKFMSRSLLAGWFPIPSGLFHFETNVSQFYQAELQALTHSPSFFQRAQINLFDTILLFALRFRPVLNEKPKRMPTPKLASGSGGVVRSSILPFRFSKQMRRQAVIAGSKNFLKSSKKKEI
jgi:hypothetical protein